MKIYTKNTNLNCFVAVRFFFSFSSHSQLVQKRMATVKQVPHKMEIHRRTYRKVAASELILIYISHQAQMNVVSLCIFFYIKYNGKHVIFIHTFVSGKLESVASATDLALETSLIQFRFFFQSFSFLFRLFVGFFAIVFIPPISTVCGNKMCAKYRPAHMQCNRATMAVS